MWGTLTINPRRLLKTGIALAITHATIQSTVMMSIHTNVAYHEREPRCSELRNRRTYMYFCAGSFSAE